MNGMRLLKATVILGGVLILVGLTMLMLRVTQKTNPVPNPTTDTQSTIIPETTLTLTAGTHIQSILSTHQGLAIWATTPENNAEILLLDANGKLKKRLFITHPGQAGAQTPKN
ncbi:MAG: hypothetical protein H7829_12690 [Magnetococcus sp. THC-1_WYH]